MNEIEARITELESMYATSKREGMAVAESWLFGELTVMRSRLRQIKRVSVAPETR